MRSRADSLAGYLPIRVYLEGDSPRVDWCYAGDKRLTESFFDQSVEDCLRRPFNLLFRPQTPIEVLGELYEEDPGLTPNGFIFHMSRCGSTLIAQMLASLPGNLVLSEPDPLHWILRGDLPDGRGTEEERARWLRWMVSALGRRRSGLETRFFIKFDSLSVIDLPLIRRAFPDVPCTFVYREPIEVLVSQLRRRGAQLVPGPYGARLLDLEVTALSSIPPEEYCARMLARLCGAAVEHCAVPRARLVNYTQLPEVLESDLLTFFGARPTEAELEQMRQVTAFDSKNPALYFSNDTGTKNREASGRVRELADAWLRPLYERLEAMRGAAPPPRSELG